MKKITSSSCHVSKSYFTCEDSRSHFHRGTFCPISSEEITVDRSQIQSVNLWRHALLKLQVRFHLSAQILIVCLEGPVSDKNQPERSRTRPEHISAPSAVTLSSSLCRLHVRLTDFHNIYIHNSLRLTAGFRWQRWKDASPFSSEHHTLTSTSLQAAASTSIYIKFAETF